MKKIIFKIIDGIAFFISIFLFEKPIMVLNLLLKKTYYFYKKKYFRHIGKNSYIEYPAVIHGANNITIGDNFYCFARIRLEAFERHLNNKYNPKIAIGDNVSINYDCHIGCVNEITIGNNVLIASKVFITDHFHGTIDENGIRIPPSSRELVSKGPVIIGDNVWIGENVSIMPNVVIGKNSIIGCNSVVTKNVPANSIVAGVPAKVIRMLIK